MTAVLVMMGASVLALLVGIWHHRRRRLEAEHDRGESEKLLKEVEGSRREAWRAEEVVRKERDRATESLAALREEVGRLGANADEAERLRKVACEAGDSCTALTAGLERQRERAVGLERQLDQARTDAADWRAAYTGTSEALHRSAQSERELERRLGECNRQRDAEALRAGEQALQLAEVSADLAEANEVGDDLQEKLVRAESDLAREEEARAVLSSEMDRARERVLAAWGPVADGEDRCSGPEATQAAPTRPVFATGPCLGCGRDCRWQPDDATRTCVVCKAEARARSEALSALRSLAPGEAPAARHYANGGKP